MSDRETCASASTCDRGSCEGCPSKAKGGNPFAIENNPGSNIKHVIGVVSGKGGVGKSFVTSQLAGMMRRAGYSVGIMDADITGPSIPKIYGVSGDIVADEVGGHPMEAEDGTRIVSMNLLLEDEEQPVVWRGPVIAGVVKQFWTDISWGDIDYLFVDMPPGTGDVPLTVFQSLPVDGIVVVTSPQDLVGLIVKKALNMAQMMNVPVLGLVENYSYLSCPDCGKQIPVFGESKVDTIAVDEHLDVLGKLPLDPQFAAKADAGRVFDIETQLNDRAKEVLEAL